MPRIILNSTPFATRLRATLGAKEILERDRKRAAKLLAGISPHGPSTRALKHAPLRELPARTTTSVENIHVTDTGVMYTMSIGVGSPATQYNVVLDNGSSNTWVGASAPYNPTSASRDTSNTVSVSYGSGKMSGRQYTDMVTLNDGLVIQNQSIGVASSTQGFDDVDGILGIGPSVLTRDTVSNTTEVPTVTDNLYAQGSISTNSLGIFYEPSSATNVANGELSFGGPDNARYTGTLDYVPITSTSPASHYWGIDQSVTYGNTTLLNMAPGIVDTGTTLLLIATDAYQAYQQATGATLDSTTGLLTVTEEQYENLQSMYFRIGEVTYELTRNAQIWPRALNRVLGGQEDRIYLVVSDLKSESGSGLDFINGYAFLQRFYSVLDTTNAQVGLATTAHTNAETN